MKTDLILRINDSGDLVLVEGIKEIQTTSILDEVFGPSNKEPLPIFRII